MMMSLMMFTNEYDFFLIDDKHKNVVCLSLLTCTLVLNFYLLLQLSLIPLLHLLNKNLFYIFLGVHF